MTYPSLRMVRKEISSDTIFVEEVANAGAQVFVFGVVNDMKAVSRAFQKLFQKRFGGLNDGKMWISSVDPRYANMNHLSSSEKAVSRAQFLDAIINVARALQRPLTDLRARPVIMSPPAKKREARMYQSVYGPDMSELHDTEEDVARGEMELRTNCEAELVMYLKLTVRTPAAEKPENWWKKNGALFPNIGRLARKWLGVCSMKEPFLLAATSSPLNDAHCHLPWSATWFLLLKTSCLPIDWQVLIVGPVNSSYCAL
ncbi:hypothetical protein DVH05_007813 [Phytophthora capsici]|nr:hypothetical protein DVH05_007813 [Phytophthora capsici]